MQEMQIQSLGQEDTLKEEIATRSSILTRKISWREEPGTLQSVGSQKAGHDRAHVYPIYIYASILSSCSFSSIPVPFTGQLSRGHVI